MVVTLPEIMTDERLPELCNADGRIVVTVAGMANEPVLPCGYSTSEVICLLYNTPLVLLKTGFSGSTEIDCKELQLINGTVPMLITVAGIVALVIGVLLNAALPIAVTVMDPVTDGILMAPPAPEYPVMVTVVLLVAIVVNCAWAIPEKPRNIRTRKGSFLCNIELIVR